MERGRGFIPFLMLFFFIVPLTVWGEEKGESSLSQEIILNTQWKVIREEDHYKVFRGEIPHSSGIYPLKIEGTLDFPLVKVTAVLDFSLRKPEWVPNMTSVTILEQISPLEKIERATYHAPWPVKDREFVVKIKAEIDYKEKTVTAVIHSVPHPQAPITDEFIRGDCYNGNISLKAVGEKTFIQLILFNDFKGSLPVWLINMLQKGWPINLVRKLEEQLAKTDIEYDDKIRPLQ